MTAGNGDGRLELYRRPGAESEEENVFVQQTIKVKCLWEDKVKQRNLLTENVTTNKELLKRKDTQTQFIFLCLSVPVQFLNTMLLWV